MCYHIWTVSAVVSLHLASKQSPQGNLIYPFFKRNFIKITGASGGWHSVFNLSQDIHGAIQIKITFFKQVRLFSFKDIRMLHRIDSHCLCTTALFLTRYSIISAQSLQVISYSGKRERSTTHSKRPTWKPGFGDTGEHHHS